MAVLMFINEASFLRLLSSEDKVPSMDSMTILVFVIEASFLRLFLSGDDAPSRDST